MVTADSRCNRCKAYACIQFSCTRCCTTLRFLAEVESVTVFRLGCCGTVRTEQHLGAAVLSVLSGFTQCTGYTIDTGTPFYFCHFARAILVRRKRQSMTSLQSNSYNGCAFSSSQKLKFSGALLGTRMLSLSDPQN